MKSCLIVDDSRVIRVIARRILEELDFEVTEAEDGRTALDLCRQGLPDGVLLDWNMPVMDGMEFLQAFRQLPGNERTSVVFCTTATDMETIQQALAAGADEYIMKPFDSDILHSKFMQVGLV